MLTLTLSRRSRAALVCRSLSALTLVLSLWSDGKAAELDLSAYRGKVVYLDFFASWCGPCRQSFPWLNDLIRRTKPADLVIVGVNVDKDRALAERFLGEFPPQFPIVYDPQGTLATNYKVTGMPSAILIDRSGRVRFQHSGFSVKKKDEYESQLRALVDETAH